MLSALARKFGDIFFKNPSLNSNGHAGSCCRQKGCPIRSPADRLRIGQNPAPIRSNLNSPVINTHGNTLNLQN
jgi:hypothetical protein